MVYAILKMEPMRYCLKYRAVAKRVGAIATLTSLSFLTVAHSVKPAIAKSTPLIAKAPSAEQAQNKRIQRPQDPIASRLATARGLIDEYTEEGFREADAILKEVEEEMRWLLTRREFVGNTTLREEFAAELATLRMQIRPTLDNPTASLSEQLAFLASVEGAGPDFYPWVRAHQDLADTYFRLGRINDALDHCMKVKNCPRRADYSTSKQSVSDAK